VKLNTQAQLASIYANKAATGTAPDPSAATQKSTINSGLKSAVYSHPNFTVVLQDKSDNKGEYYFYFNDAINNDRGKTTYTIEVTYNVAQSDSKASVKVFLCRKEGSNYWEVHPPYDAPSPKVKTSYFGTEDDCSNHANKKNYYIIDTNVFVNCPDAITKIDKKYPIILSAKVTDELDKMKIKLDEQRKMNAEKALRRYARRLFGRHGRLCRHSGGAYFPRGGPRPLPHFAEDG
jgi:LruC domain-containing protein